MPTICAFAGGGGGVKFVSSQTAPADTSGRTIWYNSSDHRLYVYSDSAWRAINTYQA